MVTNVAQNVARLALAFGIITGCLYAQGAPGQSVVPAPSASSGQPTSRSNQPSTSERSVINGLKTLDTTDPAVIGYYYPGRSAGPGQGCYVEKAFGGSLLEAAQQEVANNNAVMNPDAEGCSTPCSNPQALVGVDTANSTFTVQSTCGGAQYTNPLIPIRNPKQPPCQGPFVGNPCNIALEAKVQVETDYRSPEPDGLEFVRTYNSATTSLYNSGLSPPWQSNYNLVGPHFDPSFTVQRVEAIGTVQFWRTGGQILTFRYDSTSQTWNADPDITDTLTELSDAQQNHLGWDLVSENGEVQEIYDTTGKLTALIYRNGFQTNLTYNSNEQLSQVTDAHGRTLALNYSSDGHLESIITPDGGRISYSFDANGMLSSVTYPDSSKRTYGYTSGLLTSIVDENNNVYATWQYDSQNRPILSTHGNASSPVDRTVITYNSDGSVNVTDALNQTRTYTWVDQYGVRKFGDLNAVCSSCDQGTKKSETYDANGYPQSITDFNGNTTAYTYDANGLETQRIEAQGTPVQRTINTTWDTVFRNPLDRQVLDASGDLTAKTDWVYNTRGQVVARCEDDPTVFGATGYVCSASGTPPAGVRRWTYTYCDSVGGQCPLIGLLLSIDGPRTDVSDVTQYAYSANGDLSTTTNALGQVTQYASYDAGGRVTEIIDPNGVVTDLTYTPRGWLHTRTVAGATTTIDYDAVGNVTKVTQPDGVFTTYAYDAAHRLTSIGDALGNHVDFTLDAAGDRTAEITYASGSSSPSRSLSRVYNSLGELVKSLDAYGNATTYQYDADGNRTDATDPLGVTTHESYDALSRLAETIRNYQGTDSATANTTTAYAYDSRDNVSRITDPDGLNTDYYHNGLNDLGQLLSPDTGTTNYAYDAAGNRASQTDARGVITTYTYDALNRLTSISYPTNSLDVYYYYDEGNGATGCTSSYPIGHLTRMVDASGTTSWCYDQRGNVIAKHLSSPLTNISGVTQYTYDAADRLMSIVYPLNGFTVTYTRDTDGRISSVNSSDGMIVTSVSYLPFGPPTQYTFADGGQTLTKTYDANYRATDVAGSALNLHFTRDAMGDITAEGNAAGVPTPNESYLYDPLYRLQQVDDASGTPWQAYTYDKTGDRLTKAMAGLGTDTYSYQSGTHRLLSISGYDVSNRAVDANGNTTAFQADGWIYGLGYDNTNRMTVVQRNGSSLANYVYDGLGERVIKSVNGSGTLLFAYDESGRSLGYATSDGYGYAYIWVDNTLVATQDGPTSADTHFVYTDQLGTPRAVTNTSGTVVWDWPYNQNPFGEAAASGNGYTLNVRFPGQNYDQEDGLSYNYFRDYEPATGRYAQSDPTGLYGGISTYAYAGNSPLEFMDPTGRNVTMTCRPLSLLGAHGINGILHCSVFVWHYEKDPCTGQLHKVITAQYSLPGGAQRPTLDPYNSTYIDDRAAFNWPNDNDYNYDIAPPPGVNQQDFDNRVTQSGNTYSQGPYNLLGPNSNTSAADIISGAGGTPPMVIGAPGEYYYLMPRFP